MASIVQYHCTHCGRDFESEEKEILECPGCFWSTSVKRADDIESQEGFNVLPAKKKAVLIPWKDLLRALGFVLLILAAAGIIFGAVIPFFQKERSALKIARQNGITVSFQGDSQGDAGVSSQPAAQPVPISSEEQAVLERKIEIDPHRSLSNEEKQVLDHVVELKTGSVEKLPSQIFTEESFKKVLEDQQVFFKVSLPRSYKNKLTDLFEEKYVPAGEAFKANDLLKARDLWVESLNFPKYSDDIARHRGVALTMLRPYINDTLAKVGAINGVLVEGPIRAKEREISEAYAAHLKTLSVQAWSEALAEQAELEKLIDQLTQLQKSVSAAPPYPPAIGQIDQGIQSALADIMKAPPPSVLNVSPLKQDLQEKRKVIESLIPQNFEEQQKLYDQGLQKIQERDWREARNFLEQITFPLALVKDAQEKSQILEKIMQGTLILPEGEKDSSKTS